MSDKALEEEIERKFLVDAVAVTKLLFPDIASGNYSQIDQGYLVNGPVSLRVRHATTPTGPYKKDGPARAELTLKGPGTVKRYEKNIDIPVEYAHALLRACPGAILKHRFRQGRWEIDRFLNVVDPDTREPLWVAEIELKREDEAFDSPSWLGREVTNDVRYTNAKLSEHVVKG